MKFNVWKLVFLAHMDNQDTETWPRPSLGIGWSTSWFHSMKLHSLKKTIHFGPYFNLYIFLGPKVLTLSVDYWL